MYNPVNSESNIKPWDIPNRKPENMRILFVLSLNLALCVNQSTVATNGKIAIRGK